MTNSADDGVLQPVHSFLRAAVSVAWTVVLVCGCGSPTTPEKVVGPPQAGQIYHSVFPGGTTSDPDDISLAGVQSYESSVGKSVTWVYFSHNWFQGRAFPTATASWIRDHGSVPFIRLMMRSSSTPNVEEPTFTLARIITGDFDADLHAWAKSAKDFGSPLIVEYGTEVNGEWVTWNGKWNGGGTLDGYGDPTLPDGPERFRDAYRHIVKISRDEGANNVLWAFHVDSNDVPDETWNHLEQYYPGDEWVDWIGVSAYGAQTPIGTEWPTFRDLMDAVYPRLAALSATKPIIVFEFGVTSGNPLGDQADWANAALTDLTALQWPRIIGFSWWNEDWPNDDNPDHDTHMRVQDNPDLASVFQTLVGANAKVLGAAVLVDAPVR